MRGLRFLLCATTAMGFATTGHAQTATATQPGAPATSTPAPATEQPVSIADIVVTGSRIVRDGYDAPTPVSVITEQEIRRGAPVTVADYVNQLPALQASNSPRTALATTGGGLGGANLMNLRNLGFARTLVLLNGRRVTPSTVTNAVDVNTLPQGLVSRVDVVTGGASAAWGSDAVSGVVNFILDTKFKGLKGGIQGGISEVGDAESISGDLSWGTGFNDDRGHVVLSFNGAYQGDAWLRDHDWYKGYKILTPNPAGSPTRLVLPNATANLTGTGLIISGPLRGTLFDESGGVASTAFPFGPVEIGLLQAGGTQNADLSLNNLQIAAPLKNLSLYGRVSYDFTDDLSGFVEASYGYSHSTNYSGTFWRVDSEPISINNAYLPSSVRDRMVAAGITSFNLSHMNQDIGIPQADNTRRLGRVLVGFSGSLGDNWKWDVSAQYGESRIRNAVNNNIIPSRVLAAINAIDDGAGNIICADPAARAAGCVPYNPFGSRELTAAQRNWMTFRSLAHVRMRQFVAGVNIQGDLFDLPAGAVTLAAGAEFRRDSGGVIDSDPIASQPAPIAYVSNLRPYRGTINVKEGYAELAVPVLKDSALGKSLDLNGAVRYTDYSTSGGVTTWKIGGSYSPIDDIEFRVTRSRDIRAPNISDLFLAGTSLVQFVTDPSDPIQAGRTVTVLQTTRGNTALDPEKALSLTAGVVLRPSFLPGFSASIDYYDVKISDAISVTSSQQIINFCAAGLTTFCSALTRNASGVLTDVSVQPFNARTEQARGVDIEVGYRIPDLGGGSLDLRALANYVDKLEIVSVNPNGTTSIITRAGEAGNNLGSFQGSPHWRGLMTATYAKEPWTVQLKGRFIGAAKMETDFGPNDINRNHVPSVFYLDAFASWDMKVGSGKGQFFVAVDNVLDKAPPVVASQDPLNNQGAGTNLVIYDAIGRSYRAGFRFQF
ncbi:TonB-dependent receptor plug domain-containing protein [Sphingobium lactosutens]|uniref:TonB-dependent receptor plug domain-containing protein n=1 Tax=Sphingobium lactosutens TaxID=522773 RepID=UPI0015BCF1EC|nr:TonB-dependent receptor [Sphingobium lactosutens]